MTAQRERLGILLTQDLIFSIKVMETAKALQLHVVAVGELERAEELCQLKRPGCVLIDLTIPGLQVAETVARVRASAGERAHVIAFGPHVERALLEAAARAGCQEVYPRSKFSGQLPNLLHRCLGGTGREGPPEPSERYPVPESA
jgi:DNA-binding NarL/FixJ family response regulator